MQLARTAAAAAPSSSATSRRRLIPLAPCVPRLARHLRRPAPGGSGGDGSSSGARQQRQRPAALPADAPPPGADPGAEAPALAAVAGSLSEQQLRQLWDSVSRSLLKLGRSGVTETHARSLGELLAAHKLVKVQFNGVRDDASALAAAAAELAAGSGGAAALLQVKGSTMLFAHSSCSPEQLLAVAEAEAAGTALWRAQRQAAAAKRRGAAGARPRAPAAGA